MAAALWASAIPRLGSKGQVIAFRRGHCWCILSLLLLPILAQAEQFTGKVVGISAGSILRVIRDGREVQVHLYGVDCPERRQAFGPQARQFTRDVAYQQTVAVVVDATDRRGRLIAAVELPDGRDLSQSLVQAGYAWHDTRYAPYDRRLAQLESEARDAQRGLWAEANPIPPWEWREGYRGPARAEASQGAASSQDAIIGNRRRKVYHWPGCPDDEKVPRKNRRVFLSREAAEQAGYRPAENCP
jgi:micrococcal nuclease